MVADDSTLLREGLAMLLADEGHEVTASVGDAEALLTAMEQDPPQVAVVDVRMPPTHTDEGVRAALKIRARWPHTGVLVLSQYVERRYAAELLSSPEGGVGYLLKDRVAQVEEFLDALERVGSGRTALDPEVVRRLLSERLSPREHEVVAAMAEGHTNAAIAGKLHLSLSTVEKYVNAVFTKLGVSASAGYSRRVLAVLRYLDLRP
ncbi:response regulator transcription factor [Streptomyces axinellae]